MKVIKNVSVLIFHNDPSVRELISEQLQGLGLKVFWVDSAVMAADVLSCFPVDLVISKMLDESETEGRFWKDLNSQHAATPVLMVTEGIRESLETVEREATDGGMVSTPKQPYFRDVVLSRLFPNNKTTTRNFYRVPLDKAGHWRLSSATDFAEGTMVNVSRRGMFITCVGKPPRPGEVVEMDFPIEGVSETSLKAVGIVRWRRDGNSGLLPAGFGVEMVAIEPASFSVLDALCQPPAGAVGSGP